MAANTPKEIPLPFGGQERPKIPTEPPARFKRIACNNRRWGITRNLTGYSATRTSVGGKAPKWVLAHKDDPDDFYIAKLGATNGRAETCTELFNNELGQALGFEMAHCGIARLDSELYFITKNFRQSGERLVHGSLMIEEVFGAKLEAEPIKQKVEQSFYGIDFLKDVIDTFCKDDARAVFGKFIEMLVFDALIGSKDRHAQNWGVLQQTNLPERFRLAPIFDSARALLWSLPEHKLVLYHKDETNVRKYVYTSRPCIGPPPNHPKVNACNHFDVLEKLMEMHLHLTKPPLERAAKGAIHHAAKLLDSFPYRRYLSSLRRKLMLKVLEIRTDKMIEIAQRYA